MNVAFFGYRQWAKRIFANLKAEKSLLWKFTGIEDAHVVLYYGWSKMIPKEIYRKHLCLILHPSPLPRYRGGSPIQNQIIAGETEGAVTILRVTDKLDAGEVYSQTPFPLDGSLDEILEKIVSLGTIDTVRVLDGISTGHIEPKEQDHSKATLHKRRTPDESELTMHDFETKTARQLYNFIRCLADPYPNAYMVCRDGKRLYFTGARLEPLEVTEEVLASR